MLQARKCPWPDLDGSTVQSESPTLVGSSVDLQTRVAIKNALRWGFRR